MFRANLSFTLLSKYLAFLMQNGFLERRDGIYFPSPRGLIYLHRFARYQRAKSDVTKSEEKVRSILSIARQAYRGK